MVEAVEVILPLRIDHLEHDVALDASEDRAADDSFLLIIRSEDLLPQQVANLVGRPIAEIESRVVDREDMADLAVLGLDLLLRALDGLDDHTVLDRHAFFHTQALHQAGDAIRSEDAHEVVFERQVESGRARIALPARAPAQLIVDAPRLVTLGRDD